MNKPKENNNNNINWINKPNSKMSKEFSISYLFEPIDVVTFCTLGGPSCTVLMSDLKFLLFR